MGGPLLSASPDIVVVDSAATPPTATTQIHYVALGPDRPQVWERFGIGSWTRVPLVPTRLIRSDSNDPDIDGYFITPMTAGSFYQVRLYHDPNIDPNTQNEPRPDAAITIPSLLKGGRVIASKDRPPGRPPPGTSGTSDRVKGQQPGRHVVSPDCHDERADALFPAGGQ
jgi:hypothetical protein